MGIFDGILGGLGWVWDETVGRATSAVWDEVVGGLVGWVVDAIAWFANAVLVFFERSSTPNLASDWFAGGGIGPKSHSPYGVVAGLALSLMVLCLLAGLVQGLAAGEGPAIAGRIARDAVAAIFGIVATIGVTQVLLGATDELAHQILDQTQAGAQAKHVMNTLAQVGLFTNQSTFVVFVLGLVGVIGVLLLWIELLVRASLLYLLIALSPLAYAAFVWPAARRVLRRLAEIVVAIIFSKVVIAIALAVAASALDRGTSTVPGGEAKIGVLLAGVVMFGLAAFAPFLILKLLPVVEGAVLAQGISRGPGRAAQSAASTSFYVARLAGGAAAGGPAGAAAAGTGAKGAGGSSGSDAAAGALANGPANGQSGAGTASTQPAVSIPGAAGRPSIAESTVPAHQASPGRDVATTDPNSPGGLGGAAGPRGS